MDCFSQALIFPNAVESCERRSEMVKEVGGGGEERERKGGWGWQAWKKN